MKPIETYYRLPTSYFFKFNERLNGYFKRILLTIFILILLYPSFLWVNEFQEFSRLQEVQKILNDELAQKIKYQQSLKQHQQQLQMKDSQISEINQKLQSLFFTHQLKLTQMQWHLEKGKQAHFTVVQNFNYLFAFIEKMNEMENIAFKEIQLTKEDEKSLLKLDVILFIQGESL